jgi:hypothetical protein
VNALGPAKFQLCDLAKDDIQWAAVQNNSFHARILLMPRDGAIIFAELIGKLDLLRVACEQRRLCQTGLVATRDSQ